MRRRYTIIAAVLAPLLFARVPLAQTVPTPPSVAADSRTFILGLTAEKIGLSRAEYPYEIWGVMMDTAFPGGLVSSLLVAADGTSDMLWSTGRRIMGAGENEGVKSKSQYLLKLLNSTPAVSASPKVTEYPYPKPDEVCFYFMTRDGVKAHCESFISLTSKRSEFSRIFDAAHEVITGVRTVFEEKTKAK